jgi:hypothetical protein
MSNRRAWLGTMVVPCALALAACSSGSSTSAASSNTPPSSVSATTPQGANPGSGFCSELNAENAKLGHLGQTFSAAVASHNLASIKQTLGTYLTSAADAMVKVEASMSSAPANVQAALATVNQFFSQLRSAVANASTLKQLETSLGAAGNPAQLQAAGKTLDAYTTSQCGDLTSPSP